MAHWSLVIHGGAGVIPRGSLTQAQESAYRAALAEILAQGGDILRRGGSALDTVEAAVCALEDNPLFNAGRGAVFTAEGRNELDAAIMDGASLAAGAVTGVTRTRHPIALARAVMEHSPHVMLSGEGAEAFARTQRLEAVDPGYFYSERRWRSLERFLMAQGLPVPSRPGNVWPAGDAGLVHDEGAQGTVGAVACDAHGHVAAATSTGGTTAKRFGRVGDTPIIGAGCYASDRACAVSCTGEGEYFIRLVVAHAIAARVELQHARLQSAADAVIGQLGVLGGTGGVIAVAPDGAMAWSFNTEGMYRARLVQDGAAVVQLYADED